MKNLNIKDCEVLRVVQIDQSCIDEYVLKCLELKAEFRDTDSDLNEFFISTGVLAEIETDAFNSVLKENNVAQLLFDNGWKFMGSVEKIDIGSQEICIVEEAMNLKETLKFEKKRTKVTEKGIVFGSEGRYSSTSYTIPLRAVAMHKGGMVVLQKAYDRIKGNLKEGEKIFNTNLEELGVKL